MLNGVYIPIAYSLITLGKIFSATILWCGWIWRKFGERANQKRYQEFSSDVETEGYPSYYLQNFHHQTNGYLSDLSANLYDLQVELLFGGTADPMRRRILAPLKQGLKALIRFYPANTYFRCSLWHWSHPKTDPQRSASSIPVWYGSLTCILA
jgi:hypothetical protein